MGILFGLCFCFVWIGYQFCSKLNGDLTIYFRNISGALRRAFYLLIQTTLREVITKFLGTVVRPSHNIYLGGS